MVETIVALAVLGMFFAAVSVIIQSVLVNVGSSRVRATALALAQQKMEIIRNLPYASVGTAAGIPSGPVLQTETVTVNGLQFTVTTSIIYIDDPFDNVVPADVIPTDYKRVRVEITWGGTYPSKTPMALVTNIVPKGVESTTGGGTLYIRVFNSSGGPVGSATVNIDNTAVSPVIHMQTLTANDGTLVIPGAPACITCYQITVTKQGFSTDKTYSTSQIANPSQPDATVIAGNLTQLSFSIDQISTVTVTSVNQSYQPIANVQFTIHGNKIIGHDALDNPVYKYSYSTNTGGYTVSIPSLEWDLYTLDFTNSSHSLAGSNPTIPFQLLPNTSLTVTVVAVLKTNVTYLVTVKNNAGYLQSSASATLSNIALGYNVNKITPATGSANFGQAFFGGLQPATYDLLVSLPGYQDATQSVTLSDNQQTIITLNPF
jgi:hypothetical protein